MGWERIVKATIQLWIWMKFPEKSFFPTIHCQATLAMGLSLANKLITFRFPLISTFCHFLNRDHIDLLAWQTHRHFIFTLCHLMRCARRREKTATNKTAVKIGNYIRNMNTTKSVRTVFGTRARERERERAIVFGSVQVTEAVSMCCGCCTHTKMNHIKLHCKTFV